MRFKALRSFFSCFSASLRFDVGGGAAAAGGRRLNTVSKA